MMCAIDTVSVKRSSAPVVSPKMKCGKGRGAHEIAKQWCVLLCVWVDAIK